MAEPGAGPRGRNKRKRAHSGVIQARYILVPHPLGGYGETAFRAGENPVSLAYVEISPDGNCGAVRAGDPADIGKLIDTFKAKIANAPAKDGLVTEIDVLTDDLGEIGRDPKFLPRIVLGMDGELFIRARNPQEAKLFFQYFFTWVLAGGYQLSATWESREITAGTTHHVAVRTDQYMVNRVFAKIATGLAILHLGPTFSGLPRLRGYVLGRMGDDWQQIVREIHGPTFLQHWPEHNVSVVVNAKGRMMGLVSVHGSCHTVELGRAPNGIPDFQVVARSRKDGTSTEWVTGSAATVTGQLLLRCLDTQTTSNSDQKGIAQISEGLG